MTVLPVLSWQYCQFCCCWSLLHSAILRSRADSLRSHVILHEWLALFFLAFFLLLFSFFFFSFFFIAHFWISTEVVYLQSWHGWCLMKLLPSRCVLCTPNNHAPCHFMQSHIRKVHAYLAVTCHLYFWQNDRGLLRATAVIGGWNWYRNKSLHRKLTPEKKILPPLLQGFEPATFWSRARRSNHSQYCQCSHDNIACGIMTLFPVVSCQHCQCWHHNNNVYFYHALIGALSAHMIHIILNIFYTQIEHSPTKTMNIKYYMFFGNTHTHTHTHTRTHARTHARTHTDCSRNWIWY